MSMSTTALLLTCFESFPDSHIDRVEAVSFKGAPTVIRGRLRKLDTGQYGTPASHGSVTKPREGDYPKATAA